MNNIYSFIAIESYCNSMMITTESVKEGFHKLKALLIK